MWRKRTKRKGNIITNESYKKIFKCRVKRESQVQIVGDFTYRAKSFVKNCFLNELKNKKKNVNFFFIKEPFYLLFSTPSYKLN